MNKPRAASNHITPASAVSNKQLSRALRTQPLCCLSTPSHSHLRTSQSTTPSFSIPNSPLQANFQNGTNYAILLLPTLHHAARSRTAVSQHLASRSAADSQHSRYLRASEPQEQRHNDDTILQICAKLSTRTRQAGCSGQVKAGIDVHVAIQPWELSTTALNTSTDSWVTSPNSLPDINVAYV